MKTMFFLTVMVFFSACAHNNRSAELKTELIRAGSLEDMVVSSIGYYIRSMTNSEDMDRLIYVKSVTVSEREYAVKLPATILDGKIALKSGAHFQLVNGFLAEASSQKPCTSVALIIMPKEEGVAKVHFHWYQGPSSAGGYVFTLTKRGEEWIVTDVFQDYIS